MEITQSSSFSWNSLFIVTVFGLIWVDPIVYDDDFVIVHLVLLCCIFLILFKFNDDVLKHEKPQNPAPYDSVYGSLVHASFIVISPFTLLLGHILFCVICWNYKILRIMSHIFLLSTKDRLLVVLNTMVQYKICSHINPIIKIVPVQKMVNSDW